MTDCGSHKGIGRTPCDMSPKRQDSHASSIANQVK